MGTTRARTAPALHTCPPHFPVNREPPASASSWGRKHWSSQSPGRHPLLGSRPRPVLHASRRMPATPPAHPAPCPPGPHPHLARHADDGLEKLLHLVKPGLDVMGVLYGDQSWGRSRNASIREADQDGGSQMKYRPTGSPQRGRHPGVTLHRRALRALLEGHSASRGLSPALRAWSSAPVQVSTTQRVMKVCAEEGPSEIHRETTKGLSEWDS